MTPEITANPGRHGYNVPVGLPGSILALFAVVPSGRRNRWILSLVIGLLLAALVNVGWVTDTLLSEGPVRTLWTRFLSNPTGAIIGNGLAIVLVLMGVLGFLSGGDPDRALARKLKARGDFHGAAQLYLKAGNPSKALNLFKKSGDWKGAAEAASRLGRPTIAGDCLRQAGGHHLQEAIRLFQKAGDTENARSCSREWAAWLESRGRFTEAIDAWMQIPNVKRAAHVARHALDRKRLSTSNSAFRSAVRAASQAGDHALLARLHELEGSWERAAREWQIEGDARRAAGAYSRAGLLAEAAAAEFSAGNTERSVQLRLAHIRKLYSRLASTPDPETIDPATGSSLREIAESETRRLLPQLESMGMVEETIELLRAIGRIDEAVERLKAAGRPGAAAELARESLRWDLAAPILEEMGRWGEAGDVYEAAGDLEKAAACAERIGEDERALVLYQAVGRTVDAAHCLARLGALQDALKTLHREGKLENAFDILCSYPGPVPDIPDVILDIAAQRKAAGNPEEGVACLQRAVLGVALQAGRLEPAVALATELYELGDLESARTQLNRVLEADYSFPPALELKATLDAVSSGRDLSATRPASGAETSTTGFSLTAGQQRYEIRHELGRGGMGVVYLARDTRLDRDVAIKVLRTTSKEEAARLELEAKASATLNHPNIVTVYDFEAGFDGYFIAMELVRGTPLDALCKKTPERVHARLRKLLIDLAGALAYAHQRRVIHRDLKPANILLTEDDTVKILDFGIAARLDSKDGTSNGVCGTPFYMAPEQIRGEAPSPASDIYSLGATAFHLATGRPPFASGNVIQAHLEETPPDPRDFNPALAPDLAEAILRCLRKDPGTRFSSCSRLAEFLSS